jgi:hypothetical protein
MGGDDRPGFRATGVVAAGEVHGDSAAQNEPGTRSAFEPFWPITRRPVSDTIRLPTQSVSMYYAGCRPEGGAPRDRQGGGRASRG